MESVEADIGAVRHDDGAKESKFEVLERHAAERAELLKSFERKKSFIPRKDRTGRSRLAEEHAADEKTLGDRHAREREDLGITDADEMAVATRESGDVSGLAESVGELTVNGGGGSSFYGNEGSGETVRKESRAARRRRLRAEQEAESDRRVAEARANMGTSEREAEMEAIQKKLNVLQMSVHPIAPDGHCLYNAVAHQMHLCGMEFEVEADVNALRKATAEYMLAHADDFVMFVESVHGNLEKFRLYCEDIRNKAVWGGQVEIRALAELLGVTIEVYVAYMDVLRMGNNGQGSDLPVLRVSYHQKYYGLGEHYNSIVPKGYAV